MKLEISEDVLYIIHIERCKLFVRLHEQQQVLGGGGKRMPCHYSTALIELGAVKSAAINCFNDAVVVSNIAQH